MNHATDIRLYSRHILVLNAAAGCEQNEIHSVVRSDSIPALWREAENFEKKNFYQFFDVFSDSRMVTI